MSAAALPLAPGKALRVAIVAQDAARSEELLTMITVAGHRIVAAMRDADVVICDGDAAIAGAAVRAPIIMLGGADTHQAGSLPQLATVEQIDAAIRAVAAGLIVRSVRDRQPRFGELRSGGERALLTPREVEMLSAIGSGLSNKAIARNFDISLHTVKFHVESLFRKLGARSRAEAVAKALERSHSEMVEL